MIFAKGGYVYIMTNKLHTTFYTGVTSDINGRIWQHKNHQYPNAFTAKYNCDKLVYYSFYPHIEEAITEEKAIKSRSRDYKIQLISSLNPDWIDLFDKLMEE
jgi:putative endonuclease